MPMKRDAKTTYAQSSDIKSRTYLEYRRDMKKKAIAELEVLPWLDKKFKEMHPEKQVTVVKSGGDRFLWFLRKGGVSRAPDFTVTIGDEQIELEFQYGKKDLEFYDFKISKVTRKNKLTGQREPIRNKKLFFLDWDGPSYAIVDQEWIHKNGVQDMVQAWRSMAFRVPSQKFRELLVREPSLKALCESIDAKLGLLNFAFQLVEINKDRLSHLLQKVVDDDAKFELIPKDLDSFFKVCMILDNGDRVPRNANIWLIYLLTFISDKNTLEDVSRIVYCLDFLYMKLDKLEKNEIESLVPAIRKLLDHVKRCGQSDGSYVSSARYAPLDETRSALFSINLLEDLVQDSIHEYKVNEYTPVKRIFENVRDIERTHGYIVSNRTGADNEAEGK